MAGWRQAVALAMTGEEIEALTALCRAGDRGDGIGGKPFFRVELVPQGLRDWQIDVIGIALGLRGTDNISEICQAIPLRDSLK